MRLPAARVRASAAWPAAAITAVALLAAGCSGGATPGAGTGAAGVTAQKADAFTACMRSHREPNFYVRGTAPPVEPTAGPSGNTLTFGGFEFTWVNPRSAQFQSALKSCQHLLPVKHPSQVTLYRQFDQALRSAACMRSHGYTNWADPKMGTRGIMVAGPPTGVDTSTPQYKKAAQACGVGVP